MNMFAKRGVSPVIATVLLVILTLVAVSILAVFVINFVNSSFKGADECYKILGKVKFEDVGYNCGWPGNASSEARTGFSVRVDSDQAIALKAALTRAGSTNSYSIENGSTGGAVIRMLDGDYGQVLYVPARGGVRTYVANGSYEKLEVGAVLKSGIVCDNKETIVLNPCTEPSVISKLVAH